MSRIKFPKTRRDQVDEDVSWDQEAAIQIYRPNKEKKKKKGLDIEDGASDQPSSNRSSNMSGPYGTGKLLQRRVFDTEPVLPIATAESWNQMVSGSADGKRGRTQTGLSAHSGAIIQDDSSVPHGQHGDDYDDDVFEGPDREQERMHLSYNKAASYVKHQTTGMRPYTPGQGYYPPSQYPDMSMYSDYPDSYKPPDPMKGAASCKELAFCFWALVTYLIDVGSDIWLSYTYFKGGYYLWFGMTLAFVAIPAITMSIFSLVLYIRDWKIVGDKTPKIRWASRFIFLFLQMGPLLRIIDTILYGCKSRSKKKIEDRQQLYQRMLEEDTDSMLLRLFEAFMEAAPQLVLQLYIMTQVRRSEGYVLLAIQVFGLVTSLITLATVLVSFQKSLRLSHPNLYAPLSFCGMMGQFVWRICTIASRVLALALFASHFHYFVFVVVAVHWLFMLIWIVKQDTMYCLLRDPDGKHHHSRPFEACFRVLAAFIHIFCFFNLIEGHTRLRCIIYYSIVYFENVVLVVVWFVTATTTGENEWYYTPGLVVVCLIFWVGIGFQILYYMCCHPNNGHYLFARREIRCWVPCKELSLFQSEVVSAEETNRNSLDADVPHIVPLGEGDRSNLYPDHTSVVSAHPPSHVNGSGERVQVLMRQGGGPSLRYTPSNASSSTSTSSLLPKPNPRPYTPQKSTTKQYFTPTLPTQIEGSQTEEPSEPLPPRPVPAPRRSVSKQKSPEQTTV